MVTSAPAAPSNATFLDGSDTSATLELFRAALGPLETDYYLKVFTRFDASDRPGQSWNWAAGLFTLNWLALRKLWGPALAYTAGWLASVVLVLGIGRLVFDWSSDLQEMILAVLALVSVVVPATLGNALLYTDCRKRMERALEVNATLADACAMLKREAPSRQRLIGLFIGNAVALAALVGVVIAFPDIAMPGSRTQELANARNTAEGKTQEVSAAASPATVLPSAASAPSAFASAPIAMASKPAATTSGATATAPAPALAASTPVSSASSALAPRAQAELPAPVASVPLALSNSPANRLPGAERAASPPADSQQSARVKPERAKAAPSKPAASNAKEVPAPAAKGASAKKELAKPANHEAHFIINVGLFADENNARNAYVKLNDAGLNVLSNEITTKNGKRTRVRVGPFATQAEAERAAERIRALQLEAVIAPQ